MTRVYDYIIVGAGSAGCILANRLTEGGKYTVLLLEAGGSDDSLRFKVPIGYVYTYYDKRSNWMYSLQPQQELNNRTLYCPRGKVQGGSGSINALIYIRGQRSDFDDWAAQGNAGWSFEDVLPYYKRLESHPLGNTEYHRADGRMRITQMRDEAHPICAAFLDACAGFGYPRNDDFNGASLEGAGIYDINTRDGLRDSSSRAYLQPALDRTQLTVEHYCLVDQVLFDAEKRATGVSFRQNGERRECSAAREVILSAGAVDTPKLLQLSGVGDAALLGKHGIAVTRHSPAVGRNLQDHGCASYYYRANRKTLNDEFSSWFGKARAGLKYLLLPQGAVVPQCQPGGRLPEKRRRAGPSQYPAVLQPAVLWHSQGRLAVVEAGSLLRIPGGVLAVPPHEPGLRRDRVRRCEHRAADTAEFPEHREGRRRGHQGRPAGAQDHGDPALQAITVEETKPGIRVQTEAEMLAVFREEAGSIYHLCGSCAMGPDPATSVVSNRLKVHGIDNLRVVDASIFPNVTSGNINAPTMMVAEKGAAMILEDAGTW